MTQSSPLDCHIFDVVVIGAGVVGSAIARYLSRCACSVAVVEKESDVGMAASCRNSGVIHAGINYPPCSLRARFRAQVRGSASGQAILKAREELRGTIVIAPVSIGDTILRDVAGTDIDIVATRAVERKPPRR